MVKTQWSLCSSAKAFYPTAEPSNLDLHLLKEKKQKTEFALYMLMRAGFIGSRMIGTVKELGGFVSQ